ncbi:MAG: hypothetical protein JW981_01195 [Anaerolineae bacterium]|nr:hypothetical protein [Anaerolineae bacterium]
MIWFGIGSGIIITLLLGGQVTPAAAQQLTLGSRLLESGQTELRFSWHTPAYGFKSVEAAGLDSIAPVISDRTHLDDLPVYWFTGGLPGEPVLPYALAWIVLPPEGEVVLDVNVLAWDVRDLRTPLSLAPTIEKIQKLSLKPDGYNVITATGQAVDVVTLTEAGWMRGIRLATLVYTPFDYDAELQQLRVVRDVEVSVSFPGASFETATLPVSEVQTTQEGLSAMVLNPSLLELYHASSVTRTVTAAPIMPRWTFSVTVTGIYALPLELIPVPDIVDPDYVHITYRGQEVATQWDSDGQQFLFYADPQPSRWSVVDYYQVWYKEDEPRRRMPVRSSLPDGSESGVLWTTIEFQENRFYNSLYASPRDGDHWYWSEMMLDFAPSLIFSYTLPAFSLSDGLSATLTLWLQGNSETSASPDHKIDVLLNQSSVGSLSFDGRKAISHTFSVPVSLLHTHNTLTLTMPGLPGVPIDAVLVDAVELCFPVAGWAGYNLRLTGEVTRTTYMLDGFTGLPLVYDVTDVYTPIQLIDFIIDRHQLHFSDNIPTIHTYFVTTDNDIITVATLRPLRVFQPPQGADYLVIAPESFLPAVEPLLEHRRAQGFSTFGMPLETIYDVFGNSYADPQLIYNFIHYIYGQWQPVPAYLLLIGDGTWDPLGYLQTGTATLLPPNLAMVDPFIGEVPADNRYVTVDGADNLPDIAVGRMPANTITDVVEMVGKVIDYERSPVPGEWYKRHLFIADDEDRAGDFHAASDEVIGYLPETHFAYKIYCPDAAGDAYGNAFCDAAVMVSEIRPALLAAWNQGALVVNWMGHSSYQQWEHGRLFHIDDLSALKSQRRLPLVLEMTCFTGHFAHPEPLQTALDEALVRLPGAGAVAVWGSSGESYRHHHLPLDIAFYKVAFSGESIRLGDSTMVARLSLAYSSTILGDATYLIDTYHLFGDPATLLQSRSVPWEIYLPVVFKHFYSCCLFGG